MILSPGESTSRDLSFTSSLPLQNAIIEAVPEIAGFLTIQPNTLAALGANQQQGVRIAIGIPMGTAFGTYDGTIHDRVGAMTFPQTVKVVVNVWQAFTSTSVGFSIKYPPGWSSLHFSDRDVFSSTGKLASTEDAFGDDVEALSEANPSNLTITDWLNNKLGIDLSVLSAPDMIQGTLSDGTHYVELSGVVPSGDPDEVNVFLSKSGRVFTLRCHPGSVFANEFQLMLQSLSLF